MANAKAPALGAILSRRHWSNKCLSVANEPQLEASTATTAFSAWRALPLWHSISRGEVIPPRGLHSYRPCSRGVDRVLRRSPHPPLIARVRRSDRRAPRRDRQRPPQTLLLHASKTLTHSRTTLKTLVATPNLLVTARPVARAAYTPPPPPQAEGTNSTNTPATAPMGSL